MTTRIPDVHPGTPANAKVRIELHVLASTPKAVKVEWIECPAGSAWMPRSAVGLGLVGSRYGCEIYYVPVWLWRRVRQQLV